MSPGPNTIRKVSRFRAHLDFTTRPRTGTISVPKPAAGSVTNLLLIDASPFRPRAQTLRALRPAAPFQGRKPAKTLAEDCRRERIRAPGIGASAFSPPPSPP